MKNVISNSTYRSDIQGLRAIAVLLVVIYHSGIGYFSGGYIGVDVFFVISGYLITDLLLRELAHSGTINLVQFYARRIRRLLPAATFMLLATVLTALSLYSPLEMKQFSSSAFATATYLSNLWFAHLSTDYLAEDNDANPLLHTWSLSAEEQFYIFWPLFILIFVRNSSSLEVNKRLIKGVYMLALISFVVTVFLTKYNQPWAFFSSLTRAWEFGVGALIALKPPKEANNSIYKSDFIGFTGLALILLPACIYDKQISFPGFAALFPALGTALLIRSGYSPTNISVHRWISVKPMQFIGDISYSLYLWHWPVFVFMGFLYTDIGLIQRIGATLISFFLAWATVLLIENPFRYNKLLAQKVYKSIAFGLVLSVSSATLALVLHEISASGAASPSQQRYLAAQYDIPTIYENGCHVQTLHVDAPDCIYGNQSADITIVLFGDSHAAQWFPALEKISKQHNLRLIPITKSGCPSMSFEPFDKQLNRPYTECTEWRLKAFERIRDLKPQITILANSSNYFPEGDDGLIAPRDFETWRRGVTDTLAQLAMHSSSIVILRDTPYLKFSAPTCLSRAYWQKKDASKECIFDTTNTKSKSLYDLESKEVEAIRLGIAIDMSTNICADTICSVDKDNMVIFHDRHHLSASFSETLADGLYEKLEPILPSDKNKQNWINYVKLSN